MKEKRPIQIVVVPVNKEAYTLTVDNNFMEFRKLLGGGIESITADINYKDNTYFYYLNDMGKIDGLDYARAVYLDKNYKNPKDMIAGDFLVVKFDRVESVTTMSDEEAAYIIEEMNQSYRHPMTHLLKLMAENEVDF